MTGSPRIPARKAMPSLLWCMSLAGVLTACATVPPSEESQNLSPMGSSSPIKSESSATSHTAPSSPTPSLLPLTLQDRMAVSPLPGKSDNSPEAARQFSFRAQDMRLADALALFARVNDLNIVAGPDVEGTVTVDFQGLPLERAMAALLDAHGYYWEEERGLIVVRRHKTRLFTIDYIRLTRGGTGRSEAQVTSGQGGGGSGGGSGQSAGEISLSQEDKVQFWEELETQLQTLMSKEGRLVVNRLSGTVQVTDVNARVQEISAFISSLRRSLYRQVEIEAKIYEVTLKDDYSLGINWNKINFDGTAGAIVLSNIVGAPIGGFLPSPETTSLTYKDGSFDAVLEALKEQGEVRVVSQPRVVTLNNQPALIKVATDESFFTQTVSQGSSGTGNVITEQVRTITVGLVLSVTPQISEEGWVMLDMTPITSSLRETRISPQGTATAPVLDVKQTSALVRVKNGATALVGGLIQDTASDTERKVPILGDIPGLGYLFRGTFETTRKSELVIFITPRIVEATL